MVHNFWLVCRMTLIFYSAYSPSVKDDFKYPYHGVKMYRKFSRAVWISKIPPKTHSCLNFFKACFPPSGVPNPKNHHWLTFPISHSDLLITWIQNLFVLIDIHPKKVKSTYSECWYSKKNFLITLKVNSDVAGKSLFLLPKCAFCVKHYCGSTNLKKWPLHHVCELKMRFTH